MQYIDYSAYKAWQKCPYNWYELYVNKRRQPWNGGGQRDDALAVGTLVHAGLQRWQESRVIELPPEVVEEIGPTREAYESCLAMVHGYTQRYPEEIWPQIRCEEPLQFPLGDGLMGVAKLDAYFYVPKYTEIETGVEGQMVALEPGWWIHEYKTKSPDLSLGLWMQAWETNLQASFQMLALKAKLGEVAHGEEVRGVLVNIIEKPKLYIPKRKCKVCEVSYEFASWLPTGEGLYACPVCGNRQKLAPVKEDAKTSPPNYYRMVVTRDEETLMRHKAEILSVGEDMEYMAREGLTQTNIVPTREACVDLLRKKACPYFNHHTYNRSTLDDPMMVQVEDYLKIKED